MSTIAAVQASIAYRRAHERSGCARCEHAVYDSQAFASGQKYRLWHCQRYGFGTAPLAICQSYTARKIDQHAEANPEAGT